MQALHISPAWQPFSNPLPVLALVLLNRLGQHCVFFLSPVALLLHSGTHILLLLVFGWASFVQMRVELLMPDQILLCLLEVFKPNLAVDGLLESKVDFVWIKSFYLWIFEDYRITGYTINKELLTNLLCFVFILILHYLVLAVVGQGLR